MQCYAPLLVNVNLGGRQWRPDLIGYDALRAYGSPSYYAIQMFSRNLGDTILRPTISGAQIPVSVTQDKKTGALARSRRTELPRFWPPIPPLITR